MCLSVLPAWICVYHVCAWCLRRPKRISELPEARMTEGCELSCVFWKQNFGPLQELWALLISESSLQPSKCALKWKIKAWHPLPVFIPLQHVLLFFSSPVLSSLSLGLNLYVDITFIQLICFQGSLHLVSILFSFSFLYYSFYFDGMRDWTPDLEHARQQ